MDWRKLLDQILGGMNGSPGSMPMQDSMQPSPQQPQGFNMGTPGQSQTVPPPMDTSTGTMGGAPQNPMMSAMPQNQNMPNMPQPQTSGMQNGTDPLIMALIQMRKMQSPVGSTRG